MYAVIKSGGKQYRVEVGHVLKLETLPAEIGAEVKFDEILMVADGDDVSVGTPHVSHVSVLAEVLSHGRHKNHMKRMGHRQNYTEVKITAINKAA